MLCLCGASRRFAFAGLLCAMPLRCCAVLSYSSAMHHTAMPRPSCSSLSYAIAKFSPTLPQPCYLCYAMATLVASVPCYCCGSLLHALLRLCNASSISSMLRRCGRSVAILCLGRSELCLAVLLQCVSLPFPALPSPRESSQCLAIAPLVVSNQRHAFADRGSASLLLCPRKS